MYSISLDLETDTVIVDEQCGIIGIQHNYTVEQFKQSWEKGDAFQKADRTIMVDRLIFMDFDMAALKQFYVDNQ